MGPKSVRSERGSASPATFETPLRDADDFERKLQEEIPSSSSNTKAKEGKVESLDEFLFKHTSEDNESFEEIMDEAKRKHRAKYAWLYDSETKSIADHEAQLALPSIEKQAIEHNRPAQVETWSYTTKNYVMYVPDGAPLTSDEKLKHALDKEHISHPNTRFQSTPFDEARNREAVRQAALLQSKTREGHVDVEGKEVKRVKTPAVNGFSFVKTPSPAPGVDATPLMTWGEIEGTPFRLDGSDTPLPSSSSGPSFYLQDISERDKIGLKLAEKVGQQYRDRKGRTLKASKQGLNSPATTPGSASGSISQRLASMSPAARRLASSRLGVRLSSTHALENAFTPTPQRPSGTPTPVKRSAPSTPQLVTRGRNIDANLTDNLLQLPKRTTAKDFF
nr:EOG090X07SU [Cyclestheria hislopi]